MEKYGICNSVFPIVLGFRKERKRVLGLLKIFIGLSLGLYFMYTLHMKLMIFDYDKTLARPVQTPDEGILIEIARLLKNNYIAVVSGGRTLTQLDEFLTKRIPVERKDLLKNLLLCPWYGNEIYKWDNGYRIVFKAPTMSDKERREIFAVLDSFDWEKYGVKKIYGDQMEDRGTYISIDCLGKDATAEIKEAWDPEKAKRLVIKRDLDIAFKNKFDVYATGRNTIDVISKENTKADNTVVLAKLLNVSLSNVIFTGDEFASHGNDYPLLELDDITVNMVNSPEETLELIKRME